MTEAPGSRWYCVHTRRGMEKIAALNLGRQGFKIYLAQYSKTTRHGRKELVRKVPLFKGYIFVRFDPVADRWRAANSTYGVKSLVMEGKRPVPVPPGVIDELRARCGPQSGIQSGPDAGARNINDIGYEGLVDERAAIDVRHAGMLKGIEELGDHGRLRVLLDILNRPQPYKSAGAAR